MDSGLLNVFQDVPFDCDFIRFEGAEFWSNDSEALGLQLTDTLHGILPLEENYEMTNPNGTTNTESGSTIIYNDQTIKTTDMLTANPNNLSYGAANEVLSYDMNMLDFDERSQCSNSTFRSRTDSSSIADYESHSSDYEEDEAMAGKETNVAEDVMQEDAMLLFQPDDFTLNAVVPFDDEAGRKKRTISQATIGSDVDNLSLQIDANTFDLAEFITQDDIILDTPTVELAKEPPKPAVVKPTLVIPSKAIDAGIESDSDSDVIVDVETVEVDSEEEKLFWASRAYLQSHGVEGLDNELAYVDDTSADPSWMPKEVKKAEPATKELKTQAQLQKCNNSQTSGAAHKKPLNLPKQKPLGRPKQTMKGKSPPKREFQGSALDPRRAQPQRPTVKPGKGQGGKNLALVKQTEETVKPKTPAEQAAEPKPPNTAEATKRKLNLEEYKKRRGAISPTSAETVQDKTRPIKPSCVNPTKLTPTKHSEAVSSIVKTLKEQAQSSTVTDPITVAKNKVLRWQQQKKAQAMKILDSTVQAKIPKVTKLPPLKDIVKGVSAEHQECNAYEELIIVSASCNTVISIPPAGALATKSSQLPNNATRSLLKSSELLQKAKGGEKAQISTNSLIASIQDAVAKQTLAPQLATPQAQSANQGTELHGEDKVIMHLRKDRIRPPSASIAVQTDFQSEFPLLSFAKITTEFRRSRERIRKLKTTRKYRKHAQDNGDDDSDSSSCEDQPVCSRSRSPASCDQTGDGSNYSSRSSRRHRSSVSTSLSESERTPKERYRQRNTNFKQRPKQHSRAASYSSSSDYSDRSPNRVRSRSPFNRQHQRDPSAKHARNYNNNNNFNDRNISQPAVEERRIVYVGRIEETTTKELLRRKFLAYGNIKQVTIHYKETGMKYGFVTYERPQDAFQVIDNSTRDPQISMYDISFGGRRAFCRSSYADLDNAGINHYNSYVFPKIVVPPKQEDTFEALLLKVKAKLEASNKNQTNANKI